MPPRQHGRACTISACVLNFTDLYLARRRRGGASTLAFPVGGRHPERRRRRLHILSPPLKPSVCLILFLALTKTTTPTTPTTPPPPATPTPPTPPPLRTTNTRPTPANDPSGPPKCDVEALNGTPTTWPERRHSFVPAPSYLVSHSAQSFVHTPKLLLNRRAEVWRRWLGTSPWRAHHNIRRRSPQHWP